MKKLPIYLVLVLTISSCGGGGGGGSSDKCVDYAEFLCAKISDCFNNNSGENQCFADVVNFLADRGDTQNSCEQQSNVVADLSCEQLIALGTRSSVEGKASNKIDEVLQRAVQLSNQ